MNTNDLNTALYEKMAAEQDKFRDWLKRQPPEEILHHTYEYTVREDIVMAMEDLELTDAQAQALLDSPTPLADVYRHFEKLETGYMDVDGSPTKTEVLTSRNGSEAKTYWAACFGKRGAEDLYDLRKDPDCLCNLADKDMTRSLRTALHKQLFDELRTQQDPRVLGDGRVFDEYPHANEKMRGYYEKQMQGQKIPADWVNESDFEKTSQEK